MLVRSTGSGAGPSRERFLTLNDVAAIGPESLLDDKATFHVGWGGVGFGCVDEFRLGSWVGVWGGHVC